MVPLEVERFFDTRFWFVELTLVRGVLKLLYRAIMCLKHLLDINAHRDYAG